MTLLRTTDPAVEPVTLNDLKTFLRLSGNSEDTLLAGLVRAAREDVERTTGLALIDQTWRICIDQLPAHGTVLLRRGPVREVLAVTAYGSEGEAAVVPPSDYEADLLSRPARLHIVRRPAAARLFNGLEIDFRSGHGEAGADVPDLLRRAVTILAAHWYEFRARFDAADQPVSYPGGYDRLLSGYRDLRL